MLEGRGQHFAPDSLDNSVALRPEVERLDEELCNEQGVTGARSDSDRAAG